MTPARVLTLPGWQGSGPGHWQSRWEALHGHIRVEQHDWMRPLRGDWTARLEEVILAEPGPVLLAAHSLGCILTAWWAAHSAHTRRVAGALLVAPPDIGRDDNRRMIPGWAPVARQRLPFRGIVLASSDDPFCGLPHASRLAADWGADFVNLGAKGHLNAASGLGDWDEGRAWLAALGAAPPPAG
ncbi:RBBP9/YdeN family alpha/beta hydrolase [Ottowia testudinis]|uniref:Alpha/beta hydrolase n=1 Tax=Ottowia testudinis TaxID=2816950 RepID=A0A975CJP6_9BURK|nr:alpha/beta hydrolase [Ottowia testudinis]QTD45434.1 alpha/beta hydrolase [Ottowia testudinis]